ncbi:restriction endonuclease subunit S [Ralstonia solanacearum]|nr:restriction endonuclease subunit S [Ralstonia solanacearum]QKL65527.1 restriction endonuclease subunit S [Ralstonia solanacearum]
MSLPSYRKYKATGIEWLARVPENWGLSRLGYESWVRARLGWKGLKADEYVEDGYAFLATPNIKEKDIDFVNVNYITKERYDESPEIKLAAGDVLLAKDGSTLGTVNVVRGLPCPATVNSSIAVITPRASLDGIFLFYLFQSDFLVNTIHRIKGGMGVPHLFQEDLNKFHIPLPSIEEQAAIATFLDRETGTIDALIAEQEKLITLLAEKRQAAISHAVTRGLNPNAPMKDSGVAWLGQVPAHWDVVTFQRVVHVAEGQVNPEEQPYRSMLLIAPNHVESGTGRLIYVETAEQQAAESGKYLCNAGDVIYSKIRPALRKVCIAPKDCLCSADMYPLRGTASRLSNLFLMWFMLSESFSALAVLESERVAMPKINRESLKEVWLALPTIDEQTGIAAFLGRETAKLDALKAEAERAIDLLKERRSALIAAAVTGKIDVRDALPQELAA